jgi:uncharacterized protein (DUF924 family)
MARDFTAVLDFWFREVAPRQWFTSSPELDELIRRRFGTWLDEARRGLHDGWAATPRGRLALILVLDQFSRNLFRDSAEAYADDAKAQRLAVEGIEARMDESLTLVERQFFYLPLMHAEDRELQALSVAKFRELEDEAVRILEFAEGHRAAVERFGRFPHRNAQLKRASTAEERAFLESEESQRAGAPRPQR